MVVGAILMICVSNLRAYSGEVNKLLPQHQLSLPDIIDLHRFFSGYSLKNAGRKKVWVRLKTCNLDGKFLLLSPLSFITVDSKKLVCATYFTLVPLW